MENKKEMLISTITGAIIGAFVGFLYHKTKSGELQTSFQKVTHQLKSSKENKK